MNLAKNRRLVKAIGILSVVLFLLVFSSIFFTYTVFNGQLKEQLIDTNTELLGQVKHKLDLTLNHIDKSAIQLLKHEDVVRFFDYELNEQQSRNNQIRISNLMSNAIQSMDYIFTIDLYSYDKERLYSGNILTETDLSGDFQWVTQFERYDGFFEWITTRKVMINRSKYPVYRNVVTLVRTYPLIHSPGSRKGAITINIKEDSLFGLIENKVEADEGQTFIVDGDGVVVLHPDKRKLGKDISEFSYIRHLLNDSADSGHFIDEVDQTTSSVFYVDDIYTGWHIVRVVPESQFSRPLILFRNGLAALAVVLFVVATSSAAVIGRWTFKPVNRFMHSMRSRLTDSPKHAARKYTDEFQYFESTVQEILDDRQQLHRQVVESKPLIKWRLMSELMSGRVKSRTVLQPYLEMLSISLYSDRYVVMSVEFDNKGQIDSPRDLRLYAYALCNVAEELMNAESAGIASELDNGKCAIVMCFDDGEDRERHFMRAVAVADLMKEFVQEYLGRTITIGIGDPVEELAELRHAYKQSLEALSYKLVMGGNSIITREDITGDSSPQFYKLFGMTDGIVASVKLPDAEKTRVQVGKWFEAIAEQGVPPEMIMQLVVQCLMKAATSAAEIGVDTEGVFPEQSLVDMLNQYERLEQLEQFTVSALERLVVRIKEKRSSREKNDVIDKAMRYIQEHYMRNDLSLNLLASEFHISISHLSKLFKEQKECNFIDYVIEVRMGHAKRRLEGTEDKIRDIAEQVGYSNVNSFVRIFKKMTGLTPTEYRERNKA
ncbi:helix-turn-helix domain-containing protein [Paenibacillus sp. J5C_2022]|uniref:helix-turn-helix domain-containing protein n=1 Tax=Paenibacillus sp. J5C2022 TaxID=2977129 RepID=UPI0021D0D881|nr:helix-turn-helix domain-containing protein [Paenibacillus sp. J5C2022]MCU6707833.1 helix-turn-helix domain-containing protein [Paenibacillus sp. J5C2022]